LPPQKKISFHQFRRDFADDYLWAAADEFQKPKGCSLGMKLAANVDMANAQLDQFMHVLLWKAGPVAILCGCGWIVLRELLRRIGRRAIRDVRAPRTDHGTLKAPHCPSCNRPMVKRTARRGSRAGSEFWGCSNFPVCSDTRGL